MTKAAEAFNRSIRDAEDLLARFDEENASPNGKNGEVLKRAGLVMALAAWETYVKDRIMDEFDVWLRAVDGSPIGKFLRKRLEEDLKRFFNPNAEKTRRLFLDYFEVDIAKEWVWANYDSPAAKKALDALVSKRGDAAHQANTAEYPGVEPHQVKREELEKGIRFLKGLVTATEKAKIAS
jgi:RiboL-PSP-HEPN